MPFLAWLDRHAAPLLAGALALGLLVPPLAAALRPFLTPAVIGLLAAALLRVDWRQVRGHVGRPVLAVMLLVWMMVVVPVLVWLGVAAIGLPPTLVAALVLWASSPVLTAVPAFALLFGLDAELALLTMLATSLLQPIVQPPLALALLGLELDIGLGALMARLAGIVAVAFIVAAVVRRWLGFERLRGAAPAVGGFAVVMLIIFAVGVIDGVAEALLADPARVFLFIAAAFVASFALQALGGVIFWWLERPTALSAALASGNRNMAILIAAMGASAPADFALFFAVVQFPIYLVPAMLGPVYRRLLRGGRASG